jgi:glycerophosphoryl diester phosphodiesterase
MAAKVRYCIFMPERYIMIMPSGSGTFPVSLFKATREDKGHDMAKVRFITNLIAPVCVPANRNKSVYPITTRFGMFPLIRNLLLLAFILVSCYSPKTNSKTVKKKFDVQGHRGCRGLMPENTIPAMIKALQLGVTTLEMDAVITKDKQVILSHEPFFGWEISTTPDGKTFSFKEEKNHNIYRMNYNEVRQWDVGLKVHPRFPQQQKMKAYKPLLAEVIDSAEQYIKANGLQPVDYNIETKSDDATDNTFHPAPEEFVDLLIAVIKEKKIEKRTIIQSFDIRTLQVMRRKYPKIRTALLIEGFNKSSIQENLNKLGFTPAIYSPEFLLVNEEMVKFCHDKGMLLIPWTVNDRKNIDRLIQLGADGIITDFPDLFVQEKK